MFENVAVAFAKHMLSKLLVGGVEVTLGEEGTEGAGMVGIGMANDAIHVEDYGKLCFHAAKVIHKGQFAFLNQAITMRCSTQSMIFSASSKPAKLTLAFKFPS